ncbi:MAG: glutamate--tRNA ligase, partial [Acidobacteriota bacterium]|nr:glutamate--tRNA ligase [Acidobacteriota bacterium]
ARRHGGVFVLRIEDTDTERSSWPMVQGIIDGLRWLGLDWDEGPDVGGPHAPYFQSQRLDRHRALAMRLVETGHGYYCYCTPDEIKERRGAAEKAEGGWQYDRRCLHLDAAEITRREAAGMPRAIRFKVPAGQTGFHDLVHGDIAFDGANIEDFIVLRSDGNPTYHLSVVADDLDMAITHVVRGDDHISNTPKQVLLYRAFEAAVPQFAHVPLILGPDKKRLSKRHGATSVTEYERQGYLPEAMVNFLALLGWSPGGDREVFTRDELVENFTLEGISGGNAVFNPEKLDWFNGQHIARMAADAIVTRIEPQLREAGLWRDAYAGGDARRGLAGIVELLKPRARKLADFVTYGQPLLADQVTYDPDAVAKRLSEPGLDGHVAELRAALAELPVFDAASVEQVLRGVAEARGVKAGVLIHAVRVALTGQTVSPGLFEMVEAMGRDRTFARLDALVTFLRER